MFQTTKPALTRCQLLKPCGPDIAMIPLLLEGLIPTSYDLSILGHLLV